MADIIPGWFAVAVVLILALILALLIRTHVKFKRIKDNPKDPLFAAFLVATRVKPKLKEKEL